MSISSIAATAQTGIQQALSRFDESAQRTARMGQDDSVDPAQEAVNQIGAKAAVEANIKVMKATDEMFGALLDIKV
jgi:flagellar basal body rod protein FlgC